MIALFFMAMIIQLIAFILVLIKMFKNEGVFKGILGFIIGIYAFVWGWTKHKKLQLTKLMLVWSISIVAQIVITIMGMSALIVWIQSGQQRLQPSNVSSRSVPKTRPKPKPNALPVPSKPITTQKSVDKGISNQELIFKINNLNRLIDQNKNNEDALYSRGWLYEYKGDLLNAEKDYSQVILMNARNADALYNRGLVYIKMKKFEKAIKDFSEVLRLRPKSVDAYCNKGNAYFELGRIDQAIADYSEALKISPNDADFYFNRGMAYQTKNELNKAMMDFKEAVKRGHEIAERSLKRLEAKQKLSRQSIPKKSDQNSGKDAKKEPDQKEDESTLAQSKTKRANERLSTKSAKKERISTSSTSNLSKKGDNQKVSKKNIQKPKTPIASTPPQLDQRLAGGSVKKSIQKTKAQTSSSTAPKVGWNMDIADLVIPNKDLTGRIHGENFAVDAAKIESGILSLSKGTDFFPDQTALIFLFLREGEQLEGKKYFISRDQGSGVPHIHIKWKATGKNIPETEMFMRDYAMRLEFGEIESGKIPGKIYLSLPDKMESYMAGTFMAEVKK